MKNIDQKLNSLQDLIDRHHPMLYIIVQTIILFPKPADVSAKSRIVLLPAIMRSSNVASDQGWDGTDEDGRGIVS